MTEPTVAGKSLPFSAFNALDAIGRALHEIKAQDRLTWGDIGAVLGVSDDQAAKYAEGTATMNAVTFGRGKKEWNGRFTGYFDRLCEESRPGGCDRSGSSAVLRGALAMAEALENGGEIYPDEVKHHRAALEAARDELERQLGKIRAVA